MVTNMSGYAPATVDVTDYASFASETPAARPGAGGAGGVVLGGGNDSTAAGARRGNAPAPGTNVISVRVDATLDEGWFYEGAGIYRHVWLTKTAPVHFAQHGTCVRTEFAKATGVVTSLDPSTVFVTSEVTNESDAPVTGRVHVALMDADGNTVATMNSLPASIEAGDQHTFAVKAVVARPKLWSCEDPNLYRAVATLETGGKAIDREETSFGMRTVRFDPDHGFFLNGKPVKLKGTCNHQDHAGVGAALPDRIQAYRLERLKSMGSNAVAPRTTRQHRSYWSRGPVGHDGDRRDAHDGFHPRRPEPAGTHDAPRSQLIPQSSSGRSAMRSRSRLTSRGIRTVSSMKRLVSGLDPTRLVYRRPETEGSAKASLP